MSPIAPADLFAPFASRARSLGAWEWRLLIAFVVLGVFEGRSAEPAAVDSNAPRLTWIEPVQRWVPLHEEVAVRVESSDGAALSIRLDSGPAFLRDGRLTVTNRGTVTLSAHHPTNQEPATRSLRRHFNPAEIIIPRGSWPGYSRAEEAESVQVVNDLVFVASGYGGLTVVRRKPPEMPVRIGSADTPGYANAVRVVGNHAYVADNTQGLQVFDISRPELPVLVGSLPTDDDARCIFVTNQIAYVTTRGYGLELIDVRRPDQLRSLGSVYLGGDPWRVHVQGSFAYVTTGTAGLSIVDVSNPGFPWERSSLATGGTAIGVEVAGPVAFVAGYDFGLMTVDISRPDRPVKLGNFPTPYGFQARVAGTNAYLIDWFDGVHVLDVTHPAKPALTSSFGTTGGARDLWLADHLVYVANGISGLDEWDPSKKTGWIVEIAGSSQAAVVHNDLVYVADGSPGLVGLDASNPDAPRMQFLKRMSGEAADVQIHGEFAYMANRGNGVLAVGLGETSSISTNVPTRTRRLAHAVRVRDGFACVADDSAGLTILDLSRPHIPVVVTNLPLAGVARDLEWVGNIVYLAAEKGGLHLIDVSDPRRPRRLATVGTTSYGVGVSGGHAYSAALNLGVDIVDVRDPANPVRVANWPTTGSANDVEISGGLAIVADFSEGLSVLDVFEPAKPQLLQRLPTPGHPARFIAAGERGYILDREWGVQVVDLRLGSPQRLEPRLPSQVVTTNLPFTLEAKASSGLPVTFQVLTGNARVVGNTLVEGERGEVKLRIEQPGNEHFLPASTELTLRIVAPPQSLVWNGPLLERLPIGTRHSLSALSDRGLPVTFEIAFGPGIIDGNQLVITNHGPVRVVARQTGSADFEPATYTRTFNRTEMDAERLAAWPGYTRGQAGAVRWIGDYACVAAGGFQIYDVRNPANPIPVYSLDRLSSVSAIEVWGNRALVANTVNELALLDLGDPSRPVVLSVSRAFQQSGVRNLAMSGSHLYAVGSTGLEVLEATSATHFTSVALLPFSNGAYSVQVSEGRAYLALGSPGVAVVDIGDPRNPVVLARYDTQGNARDIVVTGTVAYIADGTAGLRIVDFSDLAKPFQIGDYNTPGTAVGVQVINNRAFVADSSRGIQVIDVSLPGTPQRLASIATDGSASDVDVRDDLFLAGLGSAGFGIGSITATGSMEWRAIEATYGDTKGISVAEGHAYLLDVDSKVQVVDVRQPNQPKWVVDHPTFGTPNALKWVGSVAYIGSDILEIVDFSDPRRPRPLGNFWDAGTVVDLEIREKRAYLATQSDGLWIIDVSNPAQPREMATLPYPERDSLARGLAFSGRHVYVADNPVLRIADVGDPNHPAWVGAYTPELPIKSLDTVGSRLVATTTYLGATLYDLSDPIRPVFLSQTGGSPAEGTVAEPGLIGFAGRQPQELGFYDTSIAEDPFPIGRIPLGASAWGVAKAGDLLFVATGNAGFESFRTRRGLRQTLTFDVPTSLTVGESVPLSAIASSGLPATLEVVTGTASLDGRNLKASVVGKVVVRATQGGNEEYLPVSTEHTMEVRLPPQNLAWNLPDAGTLNVLESHHVGATSDSALRVDVRVSSGPARIDGDQLLITNLSPVVLVARQPGDGSHAPVEVVRSINTVEIGAPTFSVWPGSAHSSIFSVAANDDRLYLAAGPGGMAVWETQDASPPRSVSSASYGFGATDARSVTVAGDRAYIADFDGSLHIFDLSDPDHPVELGSLNPGLRYGVPNGLEIEGHHLFLSNYSAGLVVVDVADPKTPRIVFESAVSECRGLRVNDGIALVTCGRDGLSVYDVRDPAHPVLLSTQGMSGYAVDVTRRGSQVAVGLSNDGYELIDLTDPGAPRRIRTEASLEAERVEYHGDRLLVANSSGFHSVDLDNLGRPVVASLPISFDRQYLSMASTPSAAYVSDGRSGVSMVDLRQPSQPSLTARVSIYTNYNDVVVSGPIACVAHSRGLEILDVSRSTGPSALASVNVGLIGTALARMGDTIYLGTWEGTVFAIDISDPTNPVIKDSVLLNNPVYDLHATADRLYVASGNSGWQVLDTSRVDDLRILQTSPAGTVAFSIVHDANWSYTLSLSYALSSQAALQIFDSSQPGEPKVVSTLPLDRYVGDLCVANGLAYVVLQSGKLYVIDVRRPAEPEILGTLALEGMPQAIHVVDGVALVGLIQGGLAIVDARDPRSPLLVGSVPLRSGAWSVSVEDGRAFVAVGEAGLQIVELAIRHPQSITSNLPARVSSTHSALALDATASSGLPITWTVLSGPAVLAVDGLHWTGVGTVRVRMHQPGNSRFREVSSERSIEVSGISVESIVSNWIAREFPDVPTNARGPLSDPDADGVPNILECLLRTHPGRPDSGDGRLPWGRADSSPEPGVWRIVLPLNRELADALDWRLEAADALPTNTWQPIPTASMLQTADSIVVSLPPPTTSQFLRLRIQLE
jgi:hypothetical protein